MDRRWVVSIRQYKVNTLLFVSVPRIWQTVDAGDTCDCVNSYNQKKSTMASVITIIFTLRSILEWMDEEEYFKVATSTISMISIDVLC